MNNIRLVVSDLDFTLLNSERKLSAVTQKMLQKIVDAGVQVVPCSARPITLMTHQSRGTRGLFGLRQKKRAGILQSSAISSRSMQQRHQSRSKSMHLPMTA